MRASAAWVSGGDSPYMCSFLRSRQWGGWLTTNCPPICGLWGLVWAGSGVLMRVSRPFVSLNKATAVLDMLEALGRRNATAAVAAGYGGSVCAADVRPEAGE